MPISGIKLCVQVRTFFTAQRPRCLRLDIGKTPAEAGIKKVRSTRPILVYVNAVAKYYHVKNEQPEGISQWLRLHASIVEGAGLVSDWGNKTPQATQQAPNK